MYLFVVLFVFVWLFRLFGIVCLFVISRLVVVLVGLDVCFVLIVYVFACEYGFALFACCRFVLNCCLRFGC